MCNLKYFFLYVVFNHAIHLPSLPQWYRVYVFQLVRFWVWHCIIITRQTQRLSRVSWKKNRSLRSAFYEIRSFIVLFGISSSSSLFQPITPSTTTFTTVNNYPPVATFHSGHGVWYFIWSVGITICGTVPLRIGNIFYYMWQVSFTSFSSRSFSLFIVPIFIVNKFKCLS